MRTGSRELAPADVSAAILRAVSAPARVTVCAIGLLPVERVFGGASFDPVDRGGRARRSRGCRSPG
jgi:hypothetical protein